MDIRSIGHAVELPTAEMMVGMSSCGTGRGVSSSPGTTASTITLAWSGGRGLVWMVSPGFTGTLIVPEATSTFFPSRCMRSLHTRCDGCTCYKNSFEGIICIKLRHVRNRIIFFIWMEKYVFICITSIGKKREVRGPTDWQLLATAVGLWVAVGLSASIPRPINVAICSANIPLIFSSISSFILSSATCTLAATSLCILSSMSAPDPESTCLLLFPLPWYAFLIPTRAPRPLTLPACSGFGRDFPRTSS